MATTNNSSNMLNVTGSVTSEFAHEWTIEITHPDYNPTSVAQIIKNKEARAYAFYQATLRHGMSEPIPLMLGDTQIGLLRCVTGYSAEMILEGFRSFTDGDDNRIQFKDNSVAYIASDDPEWYSMNESVAVEIDPALR